MYVVEDLGRIAMIKIDNLRKSFGDFLAVDGITFIVQPGEVLGFLGPNGAGKSTTMKMVTGFIRPDSGSVEVFGLDVNHNAVAAKSMMGYLPEGAPAYGDMTVCEYLKFIGDIRELDGAYKETRLQIVQEQLELKEVWHRSIDTLSKGFRRRVGIAQAIIHDPKVLILDEPTDGLDPNQKHHVRALIQQLAEDKIVVISTHILEEVTAVCSRAIIIANGRVLADASPAELEARSRYHRSLTVSAPLEVPENQVYQALTHLEGVAEVEAEKDQSCCRFTVLPVQGRDVFQPVMSLFQGNGWPVAELFVERGRLDDVFRSLTYGSEEPVKTERLEEVQ